MWHRIIGLIGGGEWEEGLENYYMFKRIAAIVAAIVIAIVAYLFHPSLF